MRMPHACILRELVLALAFAGCADPGVDLIHGPGNWTGSITVRDGVTTVLTESGTVCVGESRLIEEAEIGSGSTEEYFFTTMGGVATDGVNIYVTDRAAGVVRVYDMEGQHLGDLGGKGQGPGEMDGPKGIGIAGDGRILVQDNHARKIHVFDRDGEFLESWNRVWHGGTSWDERFTVTPSGLVYIREVTNIRDRRVEPEDWKRGMVPYGPTGHRAGAIVNIPYLEYREDSFVRWGSGWDARTELVPFIPRPQWAMAKDTSLVVGSPEEYRFDIRHPDGTTTIVERTVRPVRVQRGEFEWARQNIVLQARFDHPRWSWPGPRAPGYKPFFEGLFFDESGRIWALRELAGVSIDDCAEDSDDLQERLRRPCWRRPRVFDIFSTAGKLLTTVPFPGALSRQVLPVMDGEVVLLPQRDHLGNDIVKRYRFVPPPGCEMIARPKL
jgi:hypothetical protein